MEKLLVNGGFGPWVLKVSCAAMQLGTVLSLTAFHPQKVLVIKRFQLLSDGLIAVELRLQPLKLVFTQSYQRCFHVTVVEVYAVQRTKVH
jgi:hypothetical protein